MSSYFGTTTLGGKTTAGTLRTKTGLGRGSFYNITRDMRLLELADFSNDKIATSISKPNVQKDFENALRVHLRERLKRNRLVWYLLQTLDAKETLDIREMSASLSRACPYITATPKTWQTYARSFADWMDFSDLAIYDLKSGLLLRYKPGMQVRDRELHKSRKRGVTTPIIQYSPIEEIAERLVQALRRQGGAIDWADLSRSTISKAMASLEMLGFVKRTPKLINLTPVILEFANADPSQKAIIFGRAALNNEPFAKFIEILGVHSERGESHSVLAEELKKTIGADWKLSTGETYVKVMLDWARHANLAPGVFAKSKKGRRKSHGSTEDFFDDAKR